MDGCQAGTKIEIIEQHLDYEPSIRTLRNLLFETRLSNNDLEDKIHWSTKNIKPDAQVLEDNPSLWSPENDIVSGPQPSIPILMESTEAGRVRSPPPSSVSLKPVISSSIKEFYDSSSSSYKHHITEAEADTGGCDVENRLARLMTQFQCLAEMYNEVVSRLHEAQNDVYYLRQENSRLEASTEALIERLHVVENQHHNLLSERSFHLNFDNLKTEKVLESLEIDPFGVNSLTVSPSVSFLYDPVKPHSTTIGSQYLNQLEQGVLEALHLNTSSPLSLQNINSFASPEHDNFVTASGNTINKDVLSSLKYNLAGINCDYNDSPSSVLSLENTPRKPLPKNWPTEIDALPNLSSIFSSCLPINPTTDIPPSYVETASLLLQDDETPSKLKHQSPNFPKSISIRANSLMGSKMNSSTQSLRKKGLFSEQGSARSPTTSPICSETLPLPLAPTEKEKIGQMSTFNNGTGDINQLELTEAFDQGTYKTELCNKWQEQGVCPYGNRCQFAHGLEELRPILRHRRYKTELCRMVAAGEVCPYRHRCHFRHVLTNEEKAALLAVVFSDTTLT